MKEYVVGRNRLSLPRHSDLNFPQGNFRTARNSDLESGLTDFRSMSQLAPLFNYGTVTIRCEPR